MRRNKMTRFVFLIEEARRAEVSEKSIEDEDNNVVPITRRRPGGQRKAKHINRKSYTC